MEEAIWDIQLEQLTFSWQQERKDQLMTDYFLANGMQLQTVFSLETDCC